MNEEFLTGSGAGTEETGAPPYEPPRVLTFRGDEIVQLLGPAQACSPYDPTCSLLYGCSSYIPGG
jgi:hypothetical protein